MCLPVIRSLSGPLYTLDPFQTSRKLILVLQKGQREAGCYLYRKRQGYLSDFLRITGEKEALFVRGESLLASASLGFGRCVRGSPRDSGCELPRPSQCQGLVEETDCHHQAHQEGPGTKSPTTREYWTTDHDQFSFTWPLSTLPEKS